VYRRDRPAPIAWALVDAELHTTLAASRWSLSHGYPVRTVSLRPIRRQFLHHAVLPPRAGLDVDHVNGNLLDARRANLRHATHTLNRANVQRVRTTSGLKGVFFDRATSRWRAMLGVDYAQFHLGRYDDPRDAARAYWHGAVAIFGPYAWTNLPEDERALGDDPISARIRAHVRAMEQRVAARQLRTWRTLRHLVDDPAAAGSPAARAA
jgi:hypothetical protein